MSTTDGPMVPSYTGNDQFRLPTVSVPDLVVSDFASMIEPSVASPGGPCAPAERPHGWIRSPGQVRGRGSRWLGSLSGCALQDGAPPAVYAHFINLLPDKC